MIYQATALKAGAVGASAYGIMMVAGQDAVVGLGSGRTVPLPVFAAGAAAAGSIVADLAHNTLFAFLPLDKKYDSTEAAATSAAVNVAALYGMSAAVSTDLPGQIGLSTIVGTALLSNAIGDYIYSSVLAPMFV